ncbi:hypothetical protein B0H15DRAFT_1027044 [Mycena belliarum]|uniref:Uncharacterized protein n=1 Tax=Mycena belliarum TaxID=1033014 RepID=A0AAD6TPF8_9AGAR|nr:hypothetical protein B0H15DRAFT_1027044 [Mycena belliae]
MTSRSLLPRALDITYLSLGVVSSVSPAGDIAMRGLLLQRAAAPQERARCNLAHMMDAAVVSFHWRSLLRDGQRVDRGPLPLPPLRAHPQHRRLRLCAPRTPPALKRRRLHHAGQRVLALHASLLALRPESTPPNGSLARSSAPQSSVHHPAARTAPSPLRHRVQPYGEQRPPKSAALPSPPPDPHAARTVPPANSCVGVYARLSVVMWLGLGRAPPPPLSHPVDENAAPRAHRARLTISTDSAPELNAVERDLRVIPAGGNILLTIPHSSPPVGGHMVFSDGEAKLTLYLSFAVAIALRKFNSFGSVRRAPSVPPIHRSVPSHDKRTRTPADQNSPPPPVIELGGVRKCIRAYLQLIMILRTDNLAPRLALAR